MLENTAAQHSSSCFASVAPPFDEPSRTLPLSTQKYKIIVKKFNKLSIFRRAIQGPLHYIIFYSKDFFLQQGGVTMRTAFVSAQKKSLFHMTEFSVLTDNTYK